MPRPKLLCPRCNREVTFDDAFCRACGEPLQDDEPSPTMQASGAGMFTKLTRDTSYVQLGHYVLRLFIAGVVILALIFTGVAVYHALQPTLSGDGEGAISTPSNPGVITSDTYVQVNDHPDLYQGDEVQWICKIEGFLGSDASNNVVVGCNVYPDKGQYTIDDGEAILLVPDTINANTFDAGQKVTVTGYVDEPNTGKTKMGIESSWPEISVVDMTPGW